MKFWKNTMTVRSYPHNFSQYSGKNYTMRQEPDGLEKKQLQKFIKRFNSRVGPFFIKIVNTKTKEKILKEITYISETFLQISLPLKLRKIPVKVYIFTFTDERQRICAWCKIKMNRTEARRETHGICKPCSRKHFK